MPNYAVVVGDPLPSLGSAPISMMLYRVTAANVTEAANVITSRLHSLDQQVMYIADETAFSRATTTAQVTYGVVIG